MCRLRIRSIVDGPCRCSVPHLPSGRRLTSTCPSPLRTVVRPALPTSTHRCRDPNIVTAHTSHAASTRHAPYLVVVSTSLKLLQQPGSGISYRNLLQSQTICFIADSCIPCLNVCRCNWHQSLRQVQSLSLTDKR